MTDIDAADTIKSLRQQLAHSEMAAEAEAKYADGLKQQLTECKAESANWFKKYMEANDALAESQARDALEWVHKEGGLRMMNLVADALAMPSDSTALDEAIKQAKRNVWFEASAVCQEHHGTASSAAKVFDRMADELKD